MTGSLFDGSLFDDSSRGATISPCGRYRYDLWRRWDTGPLLGFVMLNPSTADADVDDATVRRCIGFARREGCAGIVVRNLFCLRSPKPKVLAAALKAGDDVIGPDADLWLRELADNVFGVRWIVAAWGAGFATRAANLALDARIDLADSLIGKRLYRFDDVRPWLERKPVAPHPLYLPTETPLAPYPRFNQQGASL